VSEESVRTCRICGVEKDIEDFSLWNRKDRPKVTRDTRCKKCKGAESKRAYQRKRADPEEWEKLLAYQRGLRQRPKAKAMRLALRQEKEEAERLARPWWRRGEDMARGRTPQERTARKTFQRAVKSGKVFVLNFCERCGHDFSDYRREGHHGDLVGEALVVEWLCSMCHSKEHRKIHPTPKRG